MLRHLGNYALNQTEPFIAVTIYGVVSLLVKLPCIWISLGEKTEKIMPMIAAGKGLNDKYRNC